jgi:hypothetical protein
MARIVVAASSWPKFGRWAEEHAQRHSAKVSQSDRRATDKIGAFAGVSGRTIEKIAVT